MPDHGVNRCGMKPTQPSSPWQVIFFGKVWRV